MASSDTFPVTPDYTLTRTREANLLRGRVESGREYFRSKGAPRRMFVVLCNRRAKADWNSLENFRHRLLADFFTFTDPTTGRKYSVYFDGEPQYDEVGNEEFNIRCQLVEAVGAAMDTYPTFAAGDPSVNVLTAAAEDLGASGKLWIYPGYGFRVNGTFTTVYLDEVDVTGSLSSGVLTAVSLGLHRVRVVGGAPTSLDYLI